MLYCYFEDLCTILNYIVLNDPTGQILLALAAPIIQPVKKINRMSDKEKERVSRNVPLWLQQVIMGILLSDGTLRMQGKYALMGIQQVHPELTQAIWLMCYQFKLILSGVHPIDRPNRQTAYTFQTLTLPFFLQLFKDWYTIIGNKKIKVLPHYFETMFNDLAFAFLIMGDGSWDAHSSRIVLHVNNFTLAEVQRIKAVLLSKFEISSYLVPTKKNSDRGFILKIPARDVHKVRAVVSHLILPTLQYKLGVK